VDSANFTASKGVATIKVRIKGFNLSQPVSLSVAPLPGAVQAAFAPAGFVAAAEVTGAQTSLTLTSTTHKGTVPVVIFARSGDRIHTVYVNVAFNN
jgi:hypothetical protein